MIGEIVKVDRWDLAAMFGLLLFLTGVLFWLGPLALMAIAGLVTFVGGVAGGLRNSADEEG